MSEGITWIDFELLLKNLASTRAINYEQKKCACTHCKLGIFSSLVTADHLPGCTSWGSKETFFFKLPTVKVDIYIFCFKTYIRKFHYKISVLLTLICTYVATCTIFTDFQKNNKTIKTQCYLQLKIMFKVALWKENNFLVVFVVDF